jgi:ParB family chromosome partitioning protein
MDTLTNQEKLMLLPIEQLAPGTYQPRREFEAKALQELADSIVSEGLIQPIIVRPVATGYEIIAGERRWRAAQLAGLDKVLCVVKVVSDKDAAAISLIENVQRQDLNPIEEATAYQRLLEEFDYTHESLAKTVGKSRSNITHSLRLLQLEPRVQAFLASQTLSEGHGKVLASLSVDKQYPLALTCIVQQWSVRRLEKAVKAIHDESPQQKSQLKGDNDLKRFEQVLSEQLGTEVHVEQKSSGQGWLHIRYYNQDILDGVLQHLNVKYPNEDA